MFANGVIQLLLRKNKYNTPTLLFRACPCSNSKHTTCLHRTTILTYVTPPRPDSRSPIVAPCRDMARAFFVAGNLQMCLGSKTRATIILRLLLFDRRFT